MERTLIDDARSCEPLAEATVLAVRLALDSTDAPPPSTTPTAPTSPEPPTPIGADTNATSHRQPQSRARSTVGGEMRVGGVVSSGLASEFAPGLRAGAAITLASGAWSVGATGLVLPTQRLSLGAGSVDVFLAGGGVEGCRRTSIGSGTFRAALCARLEAMHLAGEAYGFDRPNRRARALFASSLLLRSDMSIAGPIAVFAEVGAVLPVVRERFAIDGVGTVYDPPLIGATGGVGAALHFE